MADHVTPVGIRVLPDGTVEGARIPPGVVNHTAAPAAPAGWLVADGSAVSRATFPDLFAAIGVLYGPGDGSTTFNLPNLTDRFVRGHTPVGGTGGSDTHQHTVDAHSHAENFSTDPNGGIGTRVAISAAPGDPFVANQGHAHTNANFPNTGNASPGTDSRDGRPPFLNLLPIIKT